MSGQIVLTKILQKKGECYGRYFASDDISVYYWVLFLYFWVASCKSWAEQDYMGIGGLSDPGDYLVVPLLFAGFLTTKGGKNIWAYGEFSYVGNLSHWPGVAGIFVPLL